jgi:hypothetical protein
MKDPLHTNPSPAHSAPRRSLLTLIVITLLLTLTLILTGYSGKPLPSANAASITRASASSSTASYPIKVYFSKSPDSLNTNTAVFPVGRVSPTIAVGTYSLQLLIAGPTLSERSAGYFTELNTLFSGLSNCSAPLPVGGPDLTLTLNMKGPFPETGTVTVKFCRTASSPGIGTDARVTAEINATLKQFSNIKKVVILTKDGHCFGDGTGKDLCLH